MQLAFTKSVHGDNYRYTISLCVPAPFPLAKSLKSKFRRLGLAENRIDGLWLSQDRSVAPSPAYNTSDALPMKTVSSGKVVVDAGPPKLQSQSPSVVQVALPQYAGLSRNVVEPVSLVRSG